MYMPQKEQIKMILRFWIKPHIIDATDDKHLKHKAIELVIKKYTLNIFNISKFTLNIIIMNILRIVVSRFRYGTVSGGDVHLD